MSSPPVSSPPVSSPPASSPPASSPPASAPIQRVRGTSDRLPDEQRRLAALQARLGADFALFGYDDVETPILEPLDLFLRKSGDEIVARMYAFSHWNRRLCLRPEHTASVMRLYVDQLQGRSLPVRLRYAGPEFRYERPSRGRQRQYTVVGLELIGAAGAAADAEVLHLACAGLERAGVRAYRLVVGHLGVVLQMLAQLGIGEHAQELILGQMEPLARGKLSPDEAVERVVGLLGAGPSSGSGPADDALPANGTPSPDDLATSAPSLADLPPEHAAAIAADLMRRVSLPLEGGTRTPQEILKRLLAKANRPDPTERIRAAVRFVFELRAAAGSADGLGRLRDLVRSYGLSTGPLDEVETALRLLVAHGSSERPGSITWEVDLSLARGLRYYTGLVFEIYVDDRDGPLQVAGGGRYDDLIRSLGGRDATPACGFAFGVERVALAVEAQQAQPTVTVPGLPRVLLVPVAAEDLPEALALGRDLRAEGGLAVEQDVRLRGVKAALRHADRAGAAAVVVLGADERAAGSAVVRLMAAREERRVARADLVAYLRAALA